MPNTQTLSPEARDLIRRSIDWLTPKGRWTKGWGLFKIKTPNGPDTMEIEEMDELIDQRFKTQEREIEFNDPNYGYRYEVEYPLKKKDEPDASCLVGSLLINNGYLYDTVFEEAVLFLEDLAVKSGKIDLGDSFCDKDAYGDIACYCNKCYRERAGVDPEIAIERLVSLNDSNSYSHKRHVLDLFRRALKRS